MILDCRVAFAVWILINACLFGTAFISRVKDADEFAVETADTKSIEFSKKLYELFLKRDKADVLADSLPKKDERIVFCETSNLQKELYRYILELPDFKLIRECNGPCDCGVNQKVRQTFRVLPSNIDWTANGFCSSLVFPRV